MTQASGTVNEAPKRGCERILRLKEVKHHVGLSRSTIYARASQGTFPKPVNLGGRAVGWIEAEVQSWLEQRIEASREAAA